MKKKIILIFVFLYFSGTIESQNTKLVDSLKTELKNRKLDDSIKVGILTMLHEKLMFSKPEDAKSYAEQELEISKKINYNIGLALGNMHLGDYHANRNENDSAMYYNTIAKKYFVELKQIRGIIFINHSISSIEQVKGNFDKAILMTKETLNLIIKHEKEGDLKTKFIGAQHHNLAVAYIEKGSYKIALTHALKALKCFEEINHEPRKASVLKDIGVIESSLGNEMSSINYFEQAIEIHERFGEKTYLVYAFNSLGNSYENLNDYVSAVKYYDLAIEYAKEVEDNLGLSNSVNKLANIELANKQFSKAEKLFSEAKSIAEKEGLKPTLINAYEGLSHVDYQRNKFQNALKNNEKALRLSENIGALPSLKDLYKFRSEILQSVNNDTEALYYLKLHQKINDSVFNIKKTQQIEELRTIYDTEKKSAEIVLQQKEIKTLNQEVEISNLRKSLYAGGMISFIALSGLLYFGFKQHVKKNRIAQEKQEAIYKQEIEFKKKELATETLHLVQKNTFINELKENLERIKNSPELFKVEFRRLVMLLKKESAEDKDWDVFKSYFSEVHNNFDHKLKAVYEDISEKEMRLASFLRMNLSTKEIASMLNVLPDSVLKSKYRLKKKLNLDKETDLNHFLSGL